MTAQFSDFYESLDPDSLKRGKQFEHFVKWFLKADPEWATQVDQVWLWDEWPGRWGADCGIDLVFRHKNGDDWAVQSKCYSPDYDITKHDVDKFLSESNRPSIQHRLLIATTDGIGANAKQVCDAQEKPVVRFLLSDVEKSALDYPANFESLSQGKLKHSWAVVIRRDLKTARQNKGYLRNLQLSRICGVQRNTSYARNHASGYAG